MTAVSAPVRDVVNAGGIRTAILTRSRFRRDHPHIRRWLETHFFRWVIGSFEQTLPVTDAASWRICAGAEPLPDWFLAKIAAGNRDMLYIDPDHSLLREQENRIVEFLHARLHTRLAERFQRMPFAVVSAGWLKDHQRMQRKRRRGWWPSQPEALAEICITGTGRMVELRGTGLLLRSELAYESFHMQHCLGQFADTVTLSGGYGERYARGCEEGRLRIFSLRDANNHPHVTISLTCNLGEWSVDQIKGKQNGVPAARYLPDVLAALNQLRPRPNDSADLMQLGLIGSTLPTVMGQSMGYSYQPFAAVTPAERRYDLVAAMPHLIDAHGTEALAPEPVLCWLALGAGAAPAAASTSAAVEAARAVTALDGADGADDRALLRIFEQWFPDRPDLLANRNGSGDPAAQSWLGRLVSRGAARASRPSDDWALAVAEPLFHRHDLTGLAGGRIAAPAAVPAQQQQRIKDELGLGRGRDALAVSDFRRTFFAVPAFRQLSMQPDPRRGSARQLLAAHAMRMGFALRLLAQWRLMDETTGWGLLLLNAQRIRDCFDSWEAFGEAAMRGRIIQASWQSRGLGVGHDKAIATDWQAFRSSPGCAWRKLDWGSFELTTQSRNTLTNTR